MPVLRPLLRGSQRSRRTCSLSLARGRCYSKVPDDLASKTAQKTRSRLEQINSKLPKFLQRFSKPLISAPVTHISAFLLLHELTAVVPLIGLAGIFHYTQWLPPYISEGRWVSAGVEKFGRYFRRKGWLGEEGVARRYKYWSLGEGGFRVVVEYVYMLHSKFGTQRNLGL